MQFSKLLFIHKLSISIINYINTHVGVISEENDISCFNYLVPQNILVFI